VRDFVDQEVLADSNLRCLPHKGSVGRVKLDQQRALTEWGAVGGAVRDRFVKSGRSWVDFRGRADFPQGRYALAVLYQ